MTVVYIVVVSLIFTLCSSIENKYCQLQCDFGFQKAQHTVCDRTIEKCGPGPLCGPDFKIIPLSNADRQYILDIHNYLRNRVAMGFEKRGKQYSAANMKVMTYNKELEQIAQCWANTCNGSPLIHDNCRRTVEFDHVGQNLASINSSLPTINLPKALKELILLWYDEVAIFNRNWTNYTQDRGPNYKVGHYTQMVWADTSEIGCAVTYYSKHLTKTWYQLFLVCNYGPGGNYIGEPLYKIGHPASDCGPNVSPNAKYKGLCGNAKKVGEIKQKRENQGISIFQLWNWTGL